jgi:predicted PurR-regulated permease PerM
MSEWISLSLAFITLIGVIVALFFGIRAIREGRILQLVRYKNDLLEKVSNWLANVQSLYDLLYLTEDLYSIKQIPSSSINSKLVITMSISKRIHAYGRVVEEGRNIYGIAMFISKDLREATNALETCLQRSLETSTKYSKLIEGISSDDELLDVTRKFDKDYWDNLKSIDELIVQVIVKIFDARVNMLDSVIKGLDPFRNV